MSETSKRLSDKATARGRCFVIMPISDVDGYPIGHFTEVFRQLIEPAVNEANYDCILATSTNAAHLIQLEIVTQVATADLCICDLSTNNPNVLFEYGLRQAFDKPTVLIKDNLTRRIFDLSGFRDIEYDSTLRITNILEKRLEITKAIRQTVDGTKDGKQVFSLVQLMKLTKATLPESNLTSEEARYAILDSKIETLADILLREEPYNLRPSTAVNLPTLRIENFRLQFLREGVLVHDERNGSFLLLNELEALNNSDFFRHLSPEQRRDVRRNIDSFCDMFNTF